MKILHVIPSLSPSQGGPSFALPMMAKALLNQGVEVDVATTDDDGPGRRMQREIGGGYRVFYFPKQTEFYKVSLPLSAWLKQQAPAYDLMHLHGCFSHAPLAAAKAARRSSIPYIVRPLGVLNRWGMENRRRWLKDLSFRFMDRPTLDHAAAIHYTSVEEQNEAARFQLKARPVVIPLGIDVAPFQSLPAAALFHERHPETRATRNVLFMSRIHPKKGIELLLEAFAAMRVPTLHLIIAGEGDAEYASSLKQKVQSLGIQDHVTWAGFIDGSLKLAAFAATEIYVLPSYSENFGIALLEAMAAGLPCITTPHVALAADANRLKPDSLKVVSGTVELGEALTSLLRDRDQARQMGENSRALAREHFSTESMATCLVKLYSDCIAR
ncbi:MAG: glycosyltransferase [Prosthecobacter sp.]|uniref:glycosyltransferase n=1 Tax=Prosthecobacter sp. TaxID=1965333 RepID=UPI0038FDB73D